MNISIFVLLAFSLGLSHANAALDIAYCADCWCVLKPGDDCPGDMPQVVFTDSLLSNMRTVVHENPYELPCNPYVEVDCVTIPPLQAGDACVVEFSLPEDISSCPQEGSYR
jgi:hypothetical protein